MPFICQNFDSMTKKKFLVILRTLTRHFYHKNVKMIASNANVSQSICTLVHLRHACLECIGDSKEKVKLCTVGNGSLWLNQ